MTDDIQISEHIIFRKDAFKPDGEYIIRTGSIGWELPADKLDPDELRAVADHMEKQEANHADK